MGRVTEPTKVRDRRQTCSDESKKETQEAELCEWGGRGIVVGTDWKTGDNTTRSMFCIL